MAAITDKFNKVISGTTRPVATTLSAQKLSGAVTASLTAATGWDTDTALHGIMYRTDAAGAKVAGSQIDWKATLSGTTLSDFTVTAGSDDTYAIGTTVELAPTAAWGDDMATGLVVQHKQDGTHADTITTNAVGENTAAAGVTIDGLLIKDSKLATNNSVVTANITNDSVTPEKWINPYCFRAFDSVGTNLTDGNIITIDLATESYDYNNNFASDTYTAPVAGVYHFSGAITIGTIATGVDFTALIYVNDALVMNGERRTLISNSVATISGDILLAANDTVTLRGYQDSAGNETTSTGSAATWFSGHLVHAI